jgi:hypothetical protein
MKKKQEHPFYCEKKKCRKTAWDTPEYLTDLDLETIKQLIFILQNNDADAFYDLISDKDISEGLFNRILGWPEGMTYCRNKEYLRQTAIPGLIKHTLPKLLIGTY